MVKVGAVDRSMALTSPRSIYGRGLLTFTLIWQAAWLGLDPNMWPNNQDDLIASAFIVGVIVTVVLLALDVLLFPEGSLRRRVLVWANLVMLTASALTLLLSFHRFDDGWLGGATFVILAVGVAALVLPMSQAAGYIVAISALEFIVLSLNGVSYVEAILYPVYALAAGAGMASAAYSLRRAAFRVAEVDRQSAEVGRQLEIEAALRIDAEESERGIHDVVLNTLNAISRGGLAARRDDLRARCRESADLLRGLASAGMEPGVETPRRRVGEIVQRLQAAGVEVELPADQVMPVPDEVRYALLSALAEVLRNAELHSEAARIVMSLESRPGFAQLVIQDFGRGFDQGSVSEGFGLSNSVRRPMQRVGGSVEVASMPGVGTKVVLAWDAETARLGEESAISASELEASISAFVPSIAAGFGVLTALSVIFTWPLVTQPLYSISAVVLYFVTLGLLVWRSLARRPIGWVSTVLASAAAIAVYQLQSHAVPISAATPWSDWGSEAIIAIFTITILSGPKWAWPIAIVSWVIAQGGDPWELLRPGTGVLIAVTLCSLSVRRQYAKYAAILTELIRIEAANEASIEAARVRGERYRLLVDAPVVLLLESIADGSVDPDDENVRELSRVEERFVRSMMRLDPSSDVVHAMAALLASDARRNGRVLDVEVYGNFIPRSVRGGELAEVELLPELRQVVSKARPGAMRLTASTEMDEIVLRLVAPMSPELARYESTSDALVGQSLLFTADPEGDDGLWEVFIANAGSGERHHTTGHLG